MNTGRARPRITSEPFPIITEPWNDIILDGGSVITDAWYKYSWVLGRLNSQLGLSLTDADVRLKAIYVYGDDVTGAGAIGLQVFSPIQSGDGQPDVMKSMQDYGNRNTRPFLYYKWDRTQSGVPVRVLASDDAGFVFGLSGQVKIVRLHVAWRTQVFKPVANSTVGYSGELLA